MKQRVLLVALSTASLGAAAVAVTADATTPSSSTPRAAKGKTIVQIAAGDPQFSTLVKLVKQAGLAQTLSGGSFTVFAPTNKAFAKVPKATLAALGKDKEALKQVLLYHVVKGRVPASKVVKLKKAKTVEGSTVSISVRGGSVYLNSTRKVLKTDIKASNGIVHVIDGVLLPPKG